VAVESPRRRQVYDRFNLNQAEADRARNADREQGQPKVDLAGVGAGAADEGLSGRTRTIAVGARPNQITASVVVALFAADFMHPAHVLFLAGAVAAGAPFLHGDPDVALLRRE